MANPYKKADQKPKAAPGGKRPLAPVVEETPVLVAPAAPAVEIPAAIVVEEKPVVPAPAAKPAKPKAEPKKEETTTDLDELFPDLVEEKPVGKPKTLYLDAEVVDVLEKLAKKKKMSTSKVANTILRNALIGK